MSSYEKLKELALKKAEEQRTALGKELEAKGKDAVAKRAAQQVREREQREREKKLLAQKMFLNREREAKEKAKRGAAQQQLLDDVDLNPRTKTSTSPSDQMRKKPLLGSTQKIDISKHSLSSPSRPSRTNLDSSKSRKTKPSKSDDDFIGNRSDRIHGKVGGSSSGSLGKPKRSSVPLNREEKQAMKRAREFGTIPRASSLTHTASPSVGSPRPSLSSATAPFGSKNSGHIRSRPGLSNAMVALGTNKKDQRTIDEIESDIRKGKEVQASKEKTQAELDREVALLRRQKAMEEKRRSDIQAKEKQRKAKEETDDDLFDSDKESDPKTPSQKIDKTKTVKDSPATKVGSEKPLPSVSSRPREPRRNSPPIPRAGGLNPADFLPGAPLRPELKARLAQVVGSKTSARPSSSPAAKRSHSPVDASNVLKKTKISKEDPKKASPSPAAPAKKETERERFIREQEAKKATKKATKKSEQENGHAQRRRPPRQDSSEPDSYGEEEEDLDEYETEEEGDQGGTSYRDEIWKIFGKDRSKYASRVVDSDDDMEADASDVFKEEMRSARMAREEDLREEELEKQRERDKALRKKATTTSERP